MCFLCVFAGMRRRSKSPFGAWAITASPHPAAPAVPAGCPQEAPGRAGLPEGSPEWASPAEGAGGWECPWPCALWPSAEAPIAPTAPRSQCRRRVPSSAARSPPAAAQSPVSAARFQTPVGPPGCVGRRWWSAAPLDGFCRLSGLYCLRRALGQCLCSSGGTARCRTHVRRFGRRLSQLRPAVGGGVVSGLRQERAGAFWACFLALLASIAPRSASAAWHDCPSEAPETSKPSRKETSQSILSSNNNKENTGQRGPSRCTCSHSVSFMASLRRSVETLQVI